MNVDQMLQAYARNVSHEMRKNTTTSTTELRDYGYRHFSPLQFLGVFPADKSPPITKHRCFYIQNTQDSTEDGEHWLAIGRQPGETDLLFDSFARKPSATWMPHLRGMELYFTLIYIELMCAMCALGSWEVKLLRILAV